MMKQLTFLITMLMMLASLVVTNAQPTINYQGVLRDAAGSPLANTKLDLRFRLIPDVNQPGLFDLEEEHLNIVTNDFGVFTAKLGSESSQPLTVIDFSQTYHFEVAIRTEEMVAYQMLERSELSVVPVAMHAMTAENVDDSDADPENELQTLEFDPMTHTLSISGGNIVELPKGGSDGDADPENELQTLEFDPNNNTLSISSGNEIQIPTGGSDGDADPENELQQLTKDGNTIRLSRGGEVEDAVNDADPDPTNEIQTLRKNGNRIILSDGGSVEDEVEDADADPENELQMLDFDPHRNRISISGGNSITLPVGGSDGDDDPENELQKLSLLGNGNLVLSRGGGEVPLQQSPLVPTTATNGEFAFKLLQPLALLKNRPQGGIALDVAGDISTERLHTNRIFPPVNQQGISKLFIHGIQGRHIASFTSEIGSTPSSLNVGQITLGDVKLRNHLSDRDELWIRTRSGNQDVQLMRLGRTVSAINTQTLNLNDHLFITHPSRADGQTGLTMFNRGGNGNRWNFYVANGSGRLELYHRGVIKGRFMPNDGSYVKNSDIRLKRDVENIAPILDKISALSPKSYYFRDDKNASKKSLGFIAQEVREVFPDLVQEGDADENPYLSLNYDGFSVLAIKAIQEQQEIIEAQAKQISTVQKQFENLQNELLALKQLISSSTKN